MKKTICDNCGIEMGGHIITILGTSSFNLEMSRAGCKSETYGYGKGCVRTLCQEGA